MTTLAPPRAPSFARRFFLVGLLAALLTVPLLMVFLLVWDRSNTADQVKRDISQGWARDQVIRTPLLVIPYRMSVNEVVTDPDGKTRTVASVKDNALIVAPTDLRLTASLAPQTRKRALFEVVVYEADVRIDARFERPDFSRYGLDPNVLMWDKAYIGFAVGDAKGFGGAIPTLVAGSKTLDLEPGARDLPFDAAPLTGRLDASMVRDGSALPIRLSMRLKGSSRLEVDPVARTSTIDLRSAWPHPSFTGTILPEARQVSAQGFSASWATTYLSTNQPLQWLASETRTAARETFGVSLIKPVDLYAQTSRAIKYGVLFIALTFLVFFLYDVTRGQSISGVSYTLVGLGLVLFFLMLLAFAEYISFTPAYGLAAAALVALITSYSKAVLGSWRRASVIGAVLTGLYAFLYVLLQLDDYALLVGAITLFAALAALMYTTRKLDWGASSKAQPNA
jgi:inner membrane protein